MFKPATVSSVRVRRAHRRGVTLVEVLIVVAILSIIAGGVAIFAVPRYIQAQHDTAVVSARALLDVVHAWRIEHRCEGDDCPKVEDLKPKYMARDQSGKDPWGKPFEIVCENGEYGVRSAGADGKVGTTDDVVVGVASRAQ
jgi:general secretion pathway protein G